MWASAPKSRQSGSPNARKQASELRQVSPMKRGNQPSWARFSTETGDFRRALPSAQNTSPPVVADPGQEDLGLLRPAAESCPADARCRRRHEIAALILAEEGRQPDRCRRLADGRADAGRHRHLGQRHREAAVGEVVHGGDEPVRGSARGRNRRRASHARGRPAAAGRPRGRGGRGDRATGRDACPSPAARRRAGSPRPRP